MVPKPTPVITSRHMGGEGIADGGELDQRKRTHPIKNGFINGEGREKVNERKVE